MSRRHRLRLLVRQVLSQAVVETRRRRRSIASESLAAYMLVGSVAFGLVIVVGRLPVPGWEMLRSAPGAFVFGRRFAADGSGFQLVAGFGGMLVLWVAYTVAITEVQADGVTHPSARPHLAALATPQLVVGRLVSHIATVATPVVGLGAVGAAAFAAGAGRPAVAVTGSLAALAVATVAACLTYAAVLWLKLLFVTSERARSFRVPIGAVLVAAFAGTFRYARESIGLFGGLAPFRWYAALATAPMRSQPAAALAAVAVTGVAVAVGLAVAVPSARRLRAVTEPEPTDSTTTESVTTPVERLLSRTVGRPVAVVARTVWLRIRRRPTSVVYVIITAAILFTAGQTVVSRLPSTLLPVTAISVATVVATGPALNPLGNEGHALPATLTASRGHRHLLAGYAVATVVPGVGLTVLATAVAAVLTGATPAATAAGLAVAVVFGAGIPVVALAVGTALPTYEGVRVADSGIDDPGSQPITALVVGTFLLATPVIGGFHDGPSLVPVGVGLALLAVACLLAARFATRRFRSFDIDE